MAGPDAISISTELLKKYNISLYPNTPKLCLFNQKDIRGLKSGNFIFETQVKYLDSGNNNACTKLEIWLQAKNDVLIMQLANPACVGDLLLTAFGPAIRSEKEDLSGFGCNLQEWITVRIECMEGSMNFIINGKKAYQTKVKRIDSEIVGLQYRFNGAGAVRNTWIEGGNTKRIVF